MYEFRLLNMRLLFAIILLFALSAGCPFTVKAQEVSTATHSTKQQEPDPIEISAYDNKIVVKNVPTGSKLEIYSVVGIRVKEIEIKQPSGEYTVDLAKGYYIARIGETVRKIAIR